MFICASIFHKQSLLVEHKVQNGNYSKTISGIIKKVQPNSCVSYSHNQKYNFFVKSTQNIIYICMCEPQVKQIHAFKLLFDIDQNYSKELDSYSGSLNSNQKERLKSGLDSFLKKTLKQYNSGSPNLKVTNLNKELKETQDIMLLNINKILENHEKLEILVDKSKSMSNQSINMKKMANKVKQESRAQNLRLSIIIALVAILSVILIAIIIAKKK